MVLCSSFLIEDNAGDARLIQELLSEQGQSCIVARFCRLSEGFERLTLSGVDAVLLDLGLPDSQGIDTFTKISTFAPSIPVVVLTGLNDDSIALKAVRGGAQDYLIMGKIDGTLLFRILTYAVERKRTLVFP